MYKLARPLFLICETPVHAGSGSDLGIVDLPIQRERHTGFPKIEASGIKGCLRQVFEEMNALMVGEKEYRDREELKEIISYAFGPEAGDLNAGSLGFTDARLLLFPVKSMKGVFGWITCPRVLDRLQTDLNLCGVSFNFDPPSAYSLPSGSSLLIKKNMVILEEYAFEISNPDDKNCNGFASWVAENVLPDGDAHEYWREKIRHDIAVLSDDEFRHFVSLSTEVVTRTAIDNITGTVKDGALFTEEYLPSETILYSLVLASPIFKIEKQYFNVGEKGKEAMAIMDFFIKHLRSQHVIQVGGDATVGKGLVRTRI